ncbi:MAG: right-handed parallel beta-helix repeat-containing protein [Bacteroidia bacterium]
MTRKIFRTGVFIFVAWQFFFACRKDDMVSTDSSIRLSFSSDTVWFDTVFVANGTNQPLSVTKRLWVYNPSSNAVKVNISLKGNPWVRYKLNIDGQPANSVSGKLVRGKDSIIIFIQMYVDSASSSNDPTKPFIVFDEIDFNTNGNAQAVNIAGYARQAHYLRNQVLDCSTNNLHWTKDIPYVIYDSILVPHGCTLTIDAGTHIYSHVKSCFLVSGTLIVNGTTADPVIFEGDRMEPDWAEVPWQWIGIRFLTDSRDNILKNAVIKNGFIGVEVDSFSNNQDPKLLVSQCVIKNMMAFGLFGLFSDITAINNLVTNCGQYSFIGALGGNYNLYHNTFITYNSTFSRTNPTFLLDNTPYTDINGNTIATFPLNTFCINNIIYGALDDEFLLNSAAGGNISGQNVIQNCIIKTVKDSSVLNINNNLINKDPMFNNVGKNDFDLQASSPAKGNGIFVNVNTDLKGRPRNTSKPSVGCYE